MNNEKIFEAWINPLAFLEVDKPWAEIGRDQPKLDAVVGFLCAPGVPADLESLVSRYKEISREPVRLFAVPAEPEILEKLVWPLRYAKGAYVIGNYLAVISLCGIVAEMVAVLAWQIGEPRLRGEPITEADEKDLFGRTFEHLDQDPRVRALSKYGIINADMKNQFDTIREIRNRYIHLWSQDHSSLAREARRGFNASVGLVASIIGPNVSDGKIRLTQQMVRYLERKGLCRPVDSDTI